jgi:serine/threonine protein kinase
VDPQQDIPFESIRGYRVIRRLATGGTSDVLLAKAEGPHGFERTVVLKLLLAHFRNEELMEKMFAREASAYARLSHPAIVKLYDFFSEAGQLVMALEYVDGLPLHKLRAMLKQSGESLDDRASIFIAARVFAALAAAHAARDLESGEFAPVIHRDVNPSNVLIPWDGHVKLADFGIAKVAGIQGDTQAGFIKGTYGYMAPEQVKGEPVTVRADVYAASLLLWELLARRKAIQRGALPEMEVLRAMAEPSIVSLDVLRPDLPARLRNAVARGLEPLPDQRAITAEEMLVVLRESVASNEGRMVLEATLARVRNPPSELTSTHPRAPSPMKEPAVQAAVKAALAQTSPDATQPREAVVATVAPRREGSAPALSPRTPAGLGGMGFGGIMPPGSASAALARSEPPAAVSAPAPRPAGGGVKGGVPRPNIQTLRMGVQDLAPPLVESEDRPGSYSGVGSADRPMRQDRTMRGLAPAPPPDFRLEDTNPATSPMPPVMAGNEMVPSNPSDLSAFASAPLPMPSPPAPAVLGPPPPPPPASPAFGSTTLISNAAPVSPSAPASPASPPVVVAAPPASPAASTLGVTNPMAPMTVPLSSAPPPMADAAPFDPFGATFASGSGPFYAPPPPATPHAADLPMTPLSPMSPYPLVASGANGAGVIDPRRSPTLTNEATSRRGVAWALIAGIGLIASAAIVAVLIMAQRRGKVVAKVGPTVTVSASAAARPPSAVSPPVTAASVTAAREVTAPTAAVAATPATGTTTPQTLAPQTLAPQTGSAATAKGTASPTSIASAVATSAAAPSTAGTSAAATPAASASAAAAVAPGTADTAAPAGAVPITPMTSSTMGDVKPPAAAAGHRIFVDGKVAGNGTETIHVRCGVHTIKVGSSGMAQSVDVPCGGEIALEK